MKKRNLVIALMASVIAIGFSACTKNSYSNGEGADSTIIKIVGQSTVSDNLTEDANEMFAQTANDSTQLGARPAPYYNFSSITISPETPGVYPKTVTIDFGTGTTSAYNGITRSGIIKVLMHGPFNLNGSFDSLYFVNYAVNGYKKTGYITWSNFSHGDTLQWVRTDSGTVTASNGDYWHHQGQRDVVQSEGFGGPLYDNAYAITGSHTFVNSDGVTSSSVIILPLEKRADCFYIDRGQLRIDGPTNYAIIDFGNGTCDNNATFSFNGLSLYTFRF
jgi:hypothetical protein